MSPGGQFPLSRDRWEGERCVACGLTRPCAPHRWVRPDGAGLACKRCGRLMTWAEVDAEPFRLTAVVDAIRRRQGARAAERFKRRALEVRP